MSGRLELLSFQRSLSWREQIAFKFLLSVVYQTYAEELLHYYSGEKTVDDYRALSPELQRIADRIDAMMKETDVPVPNWDHLIKQGGFKKGEMVVFTSTPRLRESDLFKKAFKEAADARVKLVETDSVFELEDDTIQNELGSSQLHQKHFHSLEADAVELAGPTQKFKPLPAHHQINAGRKPRRW